MPSFSKSHSSSATLPSSVASEVKVTCWFVFGAEGAKWNAATGGSFGTVLTVTVLVTVSVSPSLSVTSSPIV